MNRPSFVTLSMHHLPYSLSDEVTAKGWTKAWDAGIRHLTQSKALSHQDAVRQLSQEPVTVQHQTQGLLTATVPAALALDVLKHNDAKHMDALERVTFDLRNAFGHDMAAQTRHVYPKEADEGMSIPALGSLWLVTWAHQADARFKGRRKRGGSHTHVTWPDDFFMEASGGFYPKIILGQTRLMEEAATASPLLLSNMGPSIPFEMKSRAQYALHVVYGHWAKQVKKGEDAKEAQLNQLIHRIVQTGQLRDQGNEQSDVMKAQAFRLRMLNWVMGSDQEARSPSLSLTRAVDAMAFYLSPSSAKDVWAKWEDRVKEYLVAGGQLSMQDACHAERMRRIAEKNPVLFATLREYQAQAVMTVAEQEGAKRSHRRRPRT